MVRPDRRQGGVGTTGRLALRSRPGGGNRRRHIEAALRVGAVHAPVGLFAQMQGVFQHRAAHRPQNPEVGGETPAPWIKASSTCSDAWPVPALGLATASLRSCDTENGRDPTQPAEAARRKRSRQAHRRHLDQACASAGSGWLGGEDTRNPRRVVSCSARGVTMTPPLVAARPPAQFVAPPRPLPPSLCLRQAAHAGQSPPPLICSRSSRLARSPAVARGRPGERVRAVLRSACNRT